MSIYLSRLKLHTGNKEKFSDQQLIEELNQPKINSLNDITSETGYNIAHISVKNNRVQFLAELVKRDINLLHRNKNDQTPWHMAIDLSETNEDAKQMASILFKPTLMQAAEKNDFRLLANLLRTDSTILQDNNNQEYEDLIKAAKTTGENSSAIEIIDSIEAEIDTENQKLHVKQLDQKIQELEQKEQKLDQELENRLNELDLQRQQKNAKILSDFTKAGGTIFSNILKENNPHQVNNQNHSSLVKAQ